MERRKFLAAAAASAIAVPAAAMPGKLPTPGLLPSDLCPDPGKLPEATAHALRAAYRIRDAILKYATWRKKNDPIRRLRAISLPYTTLPMNSGMPFDNDLDLPELDLPAVELLDAAVRDKPSRDLLAMGLRYALGAMLPKQAYSTLFPIYGMGEAPQKIITPNYVWDVEDRRYNSKDRLMYQHRAMMALLELVRGPAAEINKLIEYANYGRMAVNPLQLYIKQEGYMMEMFSWCLVAPGSSIGSICPPDNIAMRRRRDV